MSQSLKNVQAKLLKADKERLRAALEQCITDDGAVCFEHREYLARRIGAITDVARAALKEST